LVFKETKLFYFVLGALINKWVYIMVSVYQRKLIKVKLWLSFLTGALIMVIVKSNEVNNGISAAAIVFSSIYRKFTPF